MTAPHYQDDAVTLYAGDCLAVLPTLPDNSVDAVVTDPPYGLEFMGKDWDSFRVDTPTSARHRGDRAGTQGTKGTTDQRWTGPDGRSMPASRVNYGGVGKRPSTQQCTECGKRDQFNQPHEPCGKGTWGRVALDPHSAPPALLAFQQWCQLWAAECLRVLRPGGHLLAFGGTRTWHRLAVAIEDAGFEIRDTIAWLYGSGFPKSLSVHKASLTAVESRYAEARCDCLDRRNGFLVGEGARREGGSPVRDTGAERQVSESPSADSDIQVIQGAGDLALRELRNASGEEGSGHDALAEALLFPSVRIGRTEAARHGHAAVRPGLEEHPGEGATAGQGLRGVQDATGRDGAAYPSLEAVPLRGDESAPELDQPVRLVPSHGGGNHDGHAGSDPDRRNPRGVGLDDQGGRRAAVARVCSWCGLPDPDWLSSLEGLGTAAKPAHEPIIVARKPLSGTVAANILAHGTGALNIDACRIEHGDDLSRYDRSSTSGFKHGGIYGDGEPVLTPASAAGRWPANVTLDETAAAALDRMSGERPGFSGTKNASAHDSSRPEWGAWGNKPPGDRFGYADSGGASRFFYTAKAGSDERITYTKPGSGNGRVTGLGGKVRQCNVCETRAIESGASEPSCGHGDYRWAEPTADKADVVSHPTVKPLSLMRWLVRLVTPPGGLILEPFAGSGTTVEAAILEGFRCIAIEREADYLPLITQRLNRRRNPVAYLTAAGEDLGLFDEDEPA
jgi:DNA modification methylase